MNRLIRFAQLFVGNLQPHKYLENLIEELVKEGFSVASMDRQRRKWVGIGEFYLFDFKNPATDSIYDTVYGTPSDPKSPRNRPWLNSPSSLTR